MVKEVAERQGGKHGANEALKVLRVFASPFLRRCDRNICSNPLHGAPISKG
jgi:hypothetical protein